MALARISIGDHRAFEYLYQQTSAHLLGVAHRILRRRDLAEDVVHDVFVTVWTRAHQYNGALARPMTWLITMVRNRSIDRLRARGIEFSPAPHADEEGPDRHAADAEAKAAGDDAARAFEGARIGACMERLNAAHRQCLALAYYQGLTHAEVATRLDAPLGSVKVWIRRGLAQLRSCLQPARA